MKKSHKRLDVWQKSIALAKLIYEITRIYPPEEKYGLVSQMRRAAVSIPSNIAEGAARQQIKILFNSLLLRGVLSANSILK
jgi:four helix bundle protein